MLVPTNKVHWNTSKLIHLHIVYSYFCATRAELGI